MYPTAARSPPQHPEAAVTEEERVNQQMAMLLTKASDPRPSPDANSATFRIDLPEDSEQRDREAHSQELVGTPGVGPSNADWSRDRSDSRPDSLSEHPWGRWTDRGRTANRPSSTGQRSNHSRGLSREERRREIELGRT